MNMFECLDRSGNLALINLFHYPSGRHASTTAKFSLTQKLMFDAA
jgi:hypothetical protein